MQILANPAVVDLSLFLFLILGAFVPSLLIAWLSGFVVRANAPQWGLLDRPTTAGHKGHKQATPLGGGLAIAFAVILPFVVGQILLLRLHSGVGVFGIEIPTSIYEHVPGALAQTGKLWTVLGGGCCLMVVGLIDDARGLSWVVRLGVQFVVAIVVVWAWDWGLTAFLPSRLASQAVAVVWIVALVNAFNMLDNMDGLSAGVAAICAAALATMAIVSPDPNTGQSQLFIAGFVIVLIGALVGFLAHNTPPARLFMGDAGSYFIGFYLAIANMQATYTGYDSGHTHAVLAPLCIMAVPLYDMTSVIAIRLWKGGSPFQADRRHFSHRLVDAGFSKTIAVAMIYMVTAGTCIAALLLHRVSRTGAMIIFALVGCALLAMAFAERFLKRT